MAPARLEIKDSSGKEVVNKVIEDGVSDVAISELNPPGVVFCRKAGDIILAGFHYRLAKNIQSTVLIARSDVRGGVAKGSVRAKLATDEEGKPLHNFSATMTTFGGTKTRRH